jgi:ammonia channel protein AmtB
VPIAHWVWGNGFLGTAGLLDFAGGTVVHVGLVFPLRASAEDEMAGLDISLHGEALQ